jgi:hypothetical protein
MKSDSLLLLSFNFILFLELGKGNTNGTIQGQALRSDSSTGVSWCIFTKREIYSKLLHFVHHETRRRYKSSLFAYIG